MSNSAITPHISVIAKPNDHPQWDAVWQEHGDIIKPIKCKTEIGENRKPVSYTFQLHVIGAPVAVTTVAQAFERQGLKVQKLVA